MGELSMWKGCATASATRAAIFAAQLAQQGMTGPAEPFEGRRGLWEQAVGKPVTLEKCAGNGEPFRITATTFKFSPHRFTHRAPLAWPLSYAPKWPCQTLLPCASTAIAPPSVVLPPSRRNGIHRRERRPTTAFRT